MRLDEALEKAASAFGVKPPSLLIRTDIQSAEREKDAIALNPNWIATMVRQSCVDGDVGCSSSIILGIVAHELVHVLFKDPECTNPSIEARADQFARSVLNSYGLSVVPFDKLVSKTKRSYNCS